MIITVITFILGVCVVVVLIAYADLASRFRKLMKKDEEDASEIIRAADNKAQEIIREAETVSQEAKTKMTFALEEAAQKVSSDLQAKALEELGEFKKVLASQTDISKTAVEKLATQEHEEAKRQIEEYKKKKLAEIDQQVKEMVGRIAIEVLGDTFDRNQHEEMIMKALEHAKSKQLL